MPTLAILGRVQIKMYADDHLPPHFHIWTPDGEGLVILYGFELSRGMLRRGDLEVALGWAKNNIDLLQTSWASLNG